METLFEIYKIEWVLLMLVDKKVHLDWRVALSNLSGEDTKEERKAVN